MSDRKYRAVIFAKCIIAEDSIQLFHREVGEALEQLEEAAQMFGWGQALVVDEEDVLPKFDAPTEGYK